MKYDLHELGYRTNIQMFIIQIPADQYFCFSAGLGPRAPGCGISDSVQSWMDGIRLNGERTELPAKVVTQPPPQVEVVVDDDANLGPEYKYSLEANDPILSRMKRSLPNPNSKKSCALYIQTDPLFWKHVREQVRRQFINDVTQPKYPSLIRKM